MKVYVVGNLLITGDNLPITLMPKLKKAFPHVAFEHADPNENFVPEDDSIIIDTVQGIEKVTWFDCLDAFEQAHSVSPHDYDLGLHLQLLKKLHKITSVRILGVPQGKDEQRVFMEIMEALKEIY